MSLLCDPEDPTTALFLSPAAAERAGNSAIQRYKHRVSYCDVKPRQRRGEILGYQCVVHFKDSRPPSPLTNSDAERLSNI